jgi:hypothetical protein
MTAVVYQPVFGRPLPLLCAETTLVAPTMTATPPASVRHNLLFTKLPPK